MTPTPDHRHAVLALIARAGKVDSASLTRETELVGDLGIDSPKALEMMVELEELLDTEIGDEDATRLNTVGDVLDYVESVSA